MRGVTAFAFVCSIAAAMGASDSPYVTVQAEPFVTRVEAYGQVQPVALLPVKAPAAGVVSTLPLPGAAVSAGEVVAKLAGPEIDAAIARGQAAVKGAEARLVAAEKTLSVLRPQLASHLSTVQQVAQAEADAADASGAVAAAKAELTNATLGATIRVEVAGTVVSVNAATGERVTAGDTLLTIEPANQLRATAVLFGRDAELAHPGAKGMFKPASGGRSTAVEVVSVTPSADSGGVTVGARSVEPDAPWLSGAYGTLELEGPEERLVAVPTRALILDQGRWWVLVHAAEGDKPVEVIPGPARGWRTLLRCGIGPGTQIRVQNAYLEYHREIASRYQPPD
jgi:RND family efflux transporter MFP subunit